VVSEKYIVGIVRKKDFLIRSIYLPLSLYTLSRNKNDNQVQNLTLTPFRKNYRIKPFSSLPKAFFIQVPILLTNIAL
jgi:hypothetical protein